MIKLVCFVSRKWSLNIIDKFQNHKNISISKVFLEETLGVGIKKKFDFKSQLINPNSLIQYKDDIKKINPDLIIAYGWSYKIPDQICRLSKVLVLHPSNLPKYRGGSPIQNQILDGLETTEVCIFVAKKKIDSGPILFSQELSLKGYLREILKRIENIGYIGSLKIFSDIKKNQLSLIKQNERDATYVKRRTPKMSEIFLDDFSKFEAKYFYNKVRSLQKPYPKAFIKCKNNTILFLDKVSLEKD